MYLSSYNKKNPELGNYYIKACSCLFFSFIITIVESVKNPSKLHIKPIFFLCYYKIHWDCRHKTELLLFPTGRQINCSSWECSTNKLLWFLYSVNIKAESPDPTSSWRSLIPVIKVNISTVSTSKNQQKYV